jgi:DNA-binding CsgD family transcriptional regulator
MNSRLLHLQYLAKTLLNVAMKLNNLLSKHQKYLLGVALLLSSIAISIRSSNGKTSLVLHKYPALIFLLVVISSFLVVIYFQINRRKITSLSNQIKEQSKIRSEELDNRLQELTDRQLEVYNLIVLGKTNKEIVNELFIEQSTLKSHINQIYGKLNIKSRGELKSRVKY